MFLTPDILDTSSASLQLKTTAVDLGDLVCERNAGLTSAAARTEAVRHDVAAVAPSARYAWFTLALPLIRLACHRSAETNGAFLVHHV